MVRSPDLGDLRAALQAAGGVVADRSDGAIGVRQLPIERVGELASAGGVVLHELRRETATLEERFLALTGVPAAASSGPGAPPVRPDVQDGGGVVIAPDPRRAPEGAHHAAVVRARARRPRADCPRHARAARGRRTRPRAGSPGCSRSRPREDVRQLVFDASGSMAFILVLAATMATSEFRYGTAVGTYLATPVTRTRDHREVAGGRAGRVRLRVRCGGAFDRACGGVARGQGRWDAVRFPRAPGDGPAGCAGRVRSRARARRRGARAQPARRDPRVARVAAWCSNRW